MKYLRQISLFFLLLYVSANHLLTANDFRFEEFSRNNHLPNGSVTCIYNDSEGYIWLGTVDGISRFDGYELKTFRSSPFTPGLLKNNQITCITEDKQKRIWVGMKEGIAIIDKNQFSISAYDHPMVANNRISSMITDVNGFIWVALNNNGILKINPQNLEGKRYSTDQNSELKLPANEIVNLTEDKEGRIWFTTWRKGLGFINPARNKIFHFTGFGVNNNPFIIYQDLKENSFWVGTWGEGVFKFKMKNAIEMEQLPVKLTTKNNKINNEVYSITKDDYLGNIWLMTLEGLQILQKNKQNEWAIVSNSLYLNQENEGLFHSIYKDRKKNLWMGSISEGALKMDFNSKPIQHFPLFSSNTGKQHNVTAICKTNNGDLYLVINRFGLFRFDFKSGKILNVIQNMNDFLNIKSILNPKNSNEIWITRESINEIMIYNRNQNGNLDFKRKISLEQITGTNDNTIIKLYQDQFMNVWIGTNTGLYMLNNSGKLIQIAKDIPAANSIVEDKNHIWAGTEKNGLFKLTPIRIKSDIQYQKEKVVLKVKNVESLNIRSLLVDKNGHIYAGTEEGFIYIIDKSGIPKEISGEYGITEEKIQDMTEDKYGTIWITTSKRILRYNPQTHTSIYFSNSDGLNHRNLYKGTSHIINNDNVLIFGGNNGVSTIKINNPNQMDSSKMNTVHITDLHIGNKSIFELENLIDFDADNNTIKTKYSENNIRIEFSALDYTTANKIQYAYKLSKINKDWIYAGNEIRYVNYTNLPVGKYEFLIKASDENGRWSDKITTLNIEIMPPAYRSWWAYTLYIIFFAVLAYFIINMFINRLKLRNKLRISMIEKEKSEELNQIKLKYFTNISHELLTPLTIIMLQIENLQQKLNLENGPFEIMKENVNRLKRLIRQILVFRKTENGNIKLGVVKGDIITFVKKICESNFRPIIDENKYNFYVSSEEENFMAYFDPDKLDKIIYNLLSNSFKFTPKEGIVSIKISFLQRLDQTIMRLSVADSGIGIPEEDLPHIFKRFYIGGNSDQSQSHGIGLSLTHELVSLHKGTIQVKSNEGDGSVFTIEIPVSENAYDPSEMNADKVEDIFDTTPDVQQNEVKTHHPDETEKLNILVAEDNQELNKMIAEKLSEEFNVFSAFNGLDAAKIVRSNEIDLIVSDIMMPVMDGLSLCKIIKNDIDTSHVNVLMLTAKNSTEDRIECYNAGADAFISKPFEMSLLLARIKNLIASKKKKVETFQHTHEINITSMEYSSLDELFLRKSVEIVEQNLADESFDFDQFADALSTSKATLHRKIKNLTDLTPGEFIKNIRLKHAFQMLQNQAGNVSTVAYAVGFGDPRYFSKCFKIQFGITPREMLNDIKKNSTDDIHASSED